MKKPSLWVVFVWAAIVASVATVCYAQGSDSAPLSGLVRDASGIS